MKMKWLDGQRLLYSPHGHGVRTALYYGVYYPNNHLAREMETRSVGGCNFSTICQEGIFVCARVRVYR